MLAEMSQKLIDELTDRGARDLTTMRMDDIENEVYEAVDALSARVMKGVLEDQAGAFKEMRCPHCGREMADEPPREKTLTCKRGDVTWNPPVKKCKTCRGDFSPSDESVGG
jgi:hypothetical protein